MIFDMECYKRNGFFLITITLLFLIAAAPVFSQSFEEAIDHYEAEEFEEALELLKDLSGDERHNLLKGKSQLSLGQYIEADSTLRVLLESTDREISSEARYTLALMLLRTGNTTGAIDMIYPLRDSVIRTGIGTEARSLYRDLLNFLTDRQRREVFWNSNSTALRLDLIRSTADSGSPESAASMLDLLYKSGLFEGEMEDMDQLEELRFDIENAPSHPPSYSVPEGMAYHIGVSLPAGEPDHEGVSVSRNLYSGLLIAAEEFNARHTDRKLFLRFANTYADADSTRKAIHQLIWQEQADLIIGPLFSENAAEASRVAESYEIPVLTPLANSEEINEGNHYLFQLNPTFDVHGRRMARFAVNELGLDTLAVMTQANSIGRSSAIAFRVEAEQLGAHVAYYIEDDFSQNAYDLSEYTEQFNPDPEVVDSLSLKRIDGIYAPFTGQEAETLASQLLTDLEWMESQAVVMGSEEWSAIRLTDEQQRRFPIYHTQSTLGTYDSDQSTQFEEEYLNRFGQEPDRFSKIGYDTGQFLAQGLETAGNPRVLNQAFRRMPPYQGLLLHIHFDGHQINQNVHIVPTNEQARRQASQRPDSR